MPKLTKRFLDSVKLPKQEKKQTFYWDSQLPNFGIRVTVGGLVSYVIQYRNGQNKSRRLTFAKYPIGISPEVARKKARELLSMAALGDDPALEKQQARNTLTVGELVERYLEEHARPHKKERSIKEDERLLERHILKKFKSRSITEVTRADVTKFHNVMRSKPYQANRCLALLKTMFNLAENWQLIEPGANPCKFVKPFPEKNRERYLSQDELRRLGKALSIADRKKTESPAVIGALSLLLFTGCRLREILTLKWEYVDFENSRLNLPDSKVGARVIYLNDEAVEVLIRLKSTVQNGQWVIPGQRNGKPMVNITKPWERIVKRAKITNLRLNDLRHTYASHGVKVGASIPLIGGLLGHTQSSTTERYAHLSDDPLRQTSDAIGESLSKAMEGVRE